MELAPRPTIDQMCATATHFPITAAMVQATTGPIVELGVGHNSTPLFHYMCRDRKVVSIDNDIDWINFFKGPFNNASHEYYHAGEDTISKFITSDDRVKREHWSLAFVDHSPSTDRRVCVELLRNKADFIVVHDSEPLATCYEWGNIFHTFKHRFYYDFYRNGTTVVSDTMEMPLI